MAFQRNDGKDGGGRLMTPDSFQVKGRLSSGLVAPPPQSILKDTIKVYDHIWRDRKLSYLQKAYMTRKLPTMPVMPMARMTEPMV